MLFLEFKELEEELWNIDSKYVRHLVDTNNYGLVPIMEILVLIAKILLYKGR